jgi:hypothetical protein
VTCPHELQGSRVASWIVRAQLGLAACALCACGGGITPADTALVAVETEQQRECVDAFLDAGADAQNACRATVRAEWDRYWARKFDGGAE